MRGAKGGGRGGEARKNVGIRRSHGPKDQSRLGTYYITVLWWSVCGGATTAVSEHHIGSIDQIYSDSFIIYRPTSTVPIKNFSSQQTSESSNRGKKRTFLRETVHSNGYNCSHQYYYYYYYYHSRHTSALLIIVGGILTRCYLGLVRNLRSLLRRWHHHPRIQPLDSCTVVNEGKKMKPYNLRHCYRGVESLSIKASNKYLYM